MIPKFRAWNKENKEMIEVGEMDFNLQSIYYNMGNVPFEEFDIMQYTGLDDVSGTEIFEGDVVDFEISEDESLWGFRRTGRGIAVIISGMVSFMGLEDTIELTAYDLVTNEGVKLAVVGNIFENRYLIQEEN